MHNRIKNAFEEVNAGVDFKAKMKTAVADKRSGEKTRGYYFGKAAVAAVACMLVLCLGLVGYRLYFTPIAVISVDVNPSVELGVNRFDKVVSVEAFNDDGAEIASSAKVKHLNYKDAVDKLLSDTKLSEYTESEETVYITVFGNENNGVAERLMQYTQDKSNVECSHGGKGNKEAHRNGLSEGKYDAFLKLKDVNPDITVEEVKRLTMREMREMLNDNAPEHEEGEPEHEEGGRHDHPNGNEHESCDGGGQGQGGHGHGRK